MSCSSNVVLPLPEYPAMPKTFTGAISLRWRAIIDTCSGCPREGHGYHCRIAPGGGQEQDQRPGHYPADRVGRGMFRTEASPLCSSAYNVPILKNPGRIPIGRALIEGFMDQQTTSQPAAPRSGDLPRPSQGPIIDTRGRPLRDLRVSVTDRCNFRCTYCMPKEVFGKDFQFLERSQLLSFGEIHRLVRVFRDHGVEKIRLTGGEPLVRRKLERLIEMLAYWSDLDLTLTTNGSLLKQKARELKDAGLQRITVSLDSLDDQVFRAMNDVDFPVQKVLEGIDEAAAVGLCR